VRPVNAPRPAQGRLVPAQQAATSRLIVADDEIEDPATRRARLKAMRRSRKRSPRPMDVSGKSVFLIKRLIEARAQAARRQSQS
jgi:hypothetical protein